MAAFSFSRELTDADTNPSWRLQSKRRIEPRTSLLDTGGFTSWTQVPPVGIPDPHTREQMRLGKKTYPDFKPSLSGNDPYGDAGKRCGGLMEHPSKFDSKLSFPHLSNVRSTGETALRGVKQVRCAVIERS